MVWDTYSYKKAVVVAAFLLAWNISSFSTRLWGGMHSLMLSYLSLDVEIFKQSPVLISMFCFVYHCTCNVFVIRVLLTSFGLYYHDVNVMFACCRFYDIRMAQAVSAVTPSCISRGCSRSQEHH